MHKGANATETYFPAGTWYNMYNYSTVDASSGPQNVTVQVSRTALVHTNFSLFCSRFMEGLKQAPKVAWAAGHPAYQKDESYAGYMLTLFFISASGPETVSETFEQDA